MAQIIWMDPALSDLDRIADYIALDNPEAADNLVQRVFDHVEQMEIHPESGSFPMETHDRRYRQIIEPPCRVFYRYDGETVYVIFVIRSERQFRKGQLRRREKSIRKL